MKIIVTVTQSSVLAWSLQGQQRLVGCCLYRVAVDTTEATANSRTATHRSPGCTASLAEAGHTGSHELPGSTWEGQRGNMGRKTLPWFLLSFPGGSNSREYVYNVGDPASIPGWERYPEKAESELGLKLVSLNNVSRSLYRDYA